MQISSKNNIKKVWSTSLIRWEDSTTKFISKLSEVDILLTISMTVRGYLKEKLPSQKNGSFKATILKIT